MANFMQTASFQAPTDYNVEAADIARRRQYAQMLQAQSQEPLQGQMAGGWYVAPSWTQGANKALSGALAGYYDKQATEDEKKLGEKADAERKQLLANLEAVGQGVPNLASDPTKLANLNTGTATDIAPGTAENQVTPTSPQQRNRLIAQMLAQSKLPDMRDLGNKMLVAALNKDTSPIKVGKDDRLVDPSTFKTILEPTVTPKYHVVDGNLVPEPMPNQTNPVAPVFTAPKDQWSDPYTLGGQTVQKNQKTGQIRQAVTLPPQTTVSVNTDKSYFGNVAEGLAKQDVALIDAARSAPQRVESARAVKAFLDKNPITGTFAEGRLAFEKGLATAGLIDGERVKNTESLASNLASQTLDAIKTSGLGSGQGFTDKDRQFLERAKSGNIEINSGTLRQLADLNEKAALTSIKRGNEIIRKLRGSKEMGAVGGGLDEIPEPTAAGASDFKILNVRPR